ncbi:MAG: O-methyltransferase [Chitinophagales bacterium]|nr:MAG: O-methyltransferase [Chitinophagales bacterium]
MKIIGEHLRLAADYLGYRLTAKTRYGIHSPFIFSLMNEVFYDKQKYPAFEQIDRLRERLLKDTTVLPTKEAGAHSKTLSAQRTVQDITRITAVPPKYGQLLFRLVKYFKPHAILELGTGPGISTLYMAMAAPQATCITLEGDPMLAELARKNFADFNLPGLTVREGLLQETLPEALHMLNKVQFVFIDADHRKESLLANLKQCLPFLDTVSVVVLDDINWSVDMKEAWKEIISLPEVIISIDIFRMGILCFRPGIPKQHFKILY